MGKTYKQGLSFYTVDCDRYQDRRIKRLKKDRGCEGLAVYDYVLCEIYRVKGYLLEWDDDTVFDVAEYFGIREDNVRETVAYCGRIGLFDATLLGKGVVTSESIQERYCRMCARAKRNGIDIPPEYRAGEVPEMPEPAEDERPRVDVAEEVYRLSKDKEWIGEVCELHGIDYAETMRRLREFRAQCVADGKEGHESMEDAKRHFNSWLRIICNNKRKENGTTRDRKPGRAGNLLAAEEAKEYGNSF